ncbi:hypothetical protein [Raoultella terrigena]
MTIFNVVIAGVKELKKYNQYFLAVAAMPPSRDEAAVFSAPEC